MCRFKPCCELVQLCEQIWALIFILYKKHNPWKKYHTYVLLMFSSMCLFAAFVRERRHDTFE